MNIFDLQAKISLDASQFNADIEQARGSMEAVSGGISTGAIAMGNLVSGAATKAAGAVLDFAKDSVESGMTFESGMSQIAATLGMTTEDIENNVNGAGDTFDALKKKAAEMGRATNFSASQAAEGLNILAMSGFDANQSIGMIEDVLHLAAAGSMEMGSAAGYISGAMKGFADETKDSGYYADLMAKGATLANTSVSQLGEAMSSGAAGAAAYSQNAESMTVALLRLAEQGVVGSAAGTALAASMKDIYTPTDQAAKALAELGVSAYENGKALDFNDIVNNLSEALAGYSEEEANAYKQTIFGIQGLNAFNKMTVTGVEAQGRWAEALGGASEGLGEAAKQYDTMTSNLQGARDMFSSALEGFQNAVYEKLSGPLTEATNIATDALGAITQGFEEGGIRGAIESLGSFAKETLSGLWDGLELPPEVEGIAATIGEIINSFSADAAGVISSIASAVSGFMEGFSNSEAVGAISNVASSVGDFLSKFVSGVEDIVSKLAEGVKSLLDSFDAEGAGQTIGDIAAGIADFASAVLQVAGDIVSKIADGVGKFIDAFKDSGAAQSIGEVAGKVADFAKPFTEGLADIIGKVGEKFGDLIGWIADFASSAVGDIPGIMDSVGGAIEKLAPLFDLIWEKLKPVIDWLGEVAMASFEALGATIKGAWDIAVQAVQTFFDLIGDLADFVTSVLTGDFEGAAEAIKNVWNDIVEFFEGIWESIKGVFSGVYDAFAEIGQNLVDGIKNGISGAWDAFTTWVSEKFEGFVGKVKGFFGIHSPSTVFAGIGENLVLGMERGWASEWGDLERTVGNDVSGLISTSKIGFGDSAIGRSSAAGITSMLTAGAGASSQPVQVNLVLDGDVAAKVLYDPLRRVAWQKDAKEAAAYA